MSDILCNTFRSIWRLEATQSLLEESEVYKRSLLIALFVVLFAAGLVYRKTTGRKIREELKQEYE